MAQTLDLYVFILHFSSVRVWVEINSLIKGLESGRLTSRIKHFNVTHFQINKYNIQGVNNYHPQTKLSVQGGSPMWPLPMHWNIGPTLPQIPDMGPTPVPHYWNLMGSSLSALETCLNLFTWGPAPILVLTSSGGHQKRALRILLKCILVTLVAQSHNAWHNNAHSLALPCLMIIASNACSVMLTSEFKLAHFYWETFEDFFSLGSKKWRMDPVCVIDSLPLPVTSSGDPRPLVMHECVWRNQN